MKTVIIGGVAGGATAAARLRRLDEHAEIVILERTGYVSYANCGLPYYIGGSIKQRSKLTLQTPESFRSRFNIDVRVHHEALHIDRAAKAVEVHNLETGETYRESYDTLILSPGARPAAPNLPGMDSPRLFTLRTVEDTFAIADFVESEKPECAVVVGAGFIGLEMAENLTDQGVAVTVVQRPAHVMPTLDADVAALLHNQLRAHGIALELGANVTGFEDADGQVRVTIAGRKPLTADMVILAIGVAPESALAAEAGLELGIKNTIATDAHMRTSDPSIYAVGDAVETTHLVSGMPAHIALAGPANRQGRIAADNICGIDRTYKGSLGSSVMKAFDMTVAATGLTEKAATAAGLHFDSVILSPASHATYYPGAQSMTMKVLFEKPGGRILGAQIIGRDGVDKRIDVLATAIKAGMDAYDLTELDLAYAPPYSSAKDPVNMAGFMIENILDGRVAQLHWQDVEAMVGGEGEAGAPCTQPVILDTRTPQEFARGCFPGAVNIPVDELRERLDEVRSLIADAGADGELQVAVHCQSGLRSYIACRILSQEGIRCANVAGGWGFFEAMRLDRNPEWSGCGPCGMKA